MTAGRNGKMLTERGSAICLDGTGGWGEAEARKRKRATTNSKQENKKDKLQVGLTISSATDQTQASKSQLHLKVFQAIKQPQRTGKENNFCSHLQHKKIGGCSLSAWQHITWAAFTSSQRHVKTQPWNPPVARSPRRASNKPDALAVTKGQLWQFPLSLNHLPFFMIRM